MNIDVYELKTAEEKRSVWKIFKHHHYLTHDLNISCRAWVAFLGDSIVAFNSTLPLPSGTLKNSCRGHRLVVLPDYQGMGIGISLAECVGEILLHEGYRYFCKTINPKLGEGRNKSELWRATSKNGRIRKDLHERVKYRSKKINRNNLYTYSHEYIGK